MASGPVAYTPTAYTAGRVRSFAACGLNAERIAAILDISADTLHKHYPRELDLAADEANAAVAQALYRTATNEGWDREPGSGTVPPNVQVQAQIAWLKMRAGWRDRSDDAPRVNVLNAVQVDASTKTIVANVQGLDDATLKGLVETLGKLLPAPTDPSSGT